LERPTRRLCCGWASCQAAFGVVDRDGNALTADDDDDDAGEALDLEMEVTDGGLDVFAVASGVLGCTVCLLTTGVARGSCTGSDLTPGLLAGVDGFAAFTGLRCTGALFLAGAGADLAAAGLFLVFEPDFLVTDGPKSSSEPSSYSSESSSDLSKSSDASLSE
jgi:hypothetical protein